MERYAKDFEDYTQPAAWRSQKSPEEIKESWERDQVAIDSLFGV